MRDIRRKNKSQSENELNSSGASRSSSQKKSKVVVGRLPSGVSAKKLLLFAVIAGLLLAAALAYLQLAGSPKDNNDSPPPITVDETERVKQEIRNELKNSNLDELPINTFKPENGDKDIVR